MSVTRDDAAGPSPAPSPREDTHLSIEERYDEVRQLISMGKVALHAKIKVRLPKWQKLKSEGDEKHKPGAIVQTTYGRILFNQILPRGLDFYNKGMKSGDLAFFYHSNSNPSGIVGVMEIVGEPYPDPTQFQPKSDYYDPKSPKDNPRWLARDVRLVEKFKRVISLAELRDTPGLQDMQVVRRGQRLSVMPVEEAEWEIDMKLAKAGN